MIKRRFMTAVFFSIILSFILLIPATLGDTGHAAMDSTTQKSIRLPIIMYHSILSDHQKWDVYVASPDDLKKDMKYLKENGFETIVVQDLIDYVKGQRALPAKPVMITFDDGHYNNLYYALPILKEMSMRAVITIVGIYADAYSEKPDPDLNYAYLSWNEIWYLSESGYFEVQNDSYAMHTLNGRKGCQRNIGEPETSYCVSFNADLIKQQDLLQKTAALPPQRLYTLLALYALKRRIA